MRNLIAVFVIGVIAFTISSCGIDQGLVGPETSGSQIRSGLPAGAVVDSAYLMLHVSEPGGLTITVRPQTSPWDESSVTWSAVGDWLSPFVVALFSGADTGWVKIDVSGLVSLWRDNIWANNGIILDQGAPEFQKTSFHSREAPGLGPQLMIYCSSDSCPVHILTATADAYVRNDQSGVNFGSDTLLSSGWTTSDTAKHRSLIQFNFNQPQPLYRIGSRVWYDANANGIQDIGEEGIPEAGVILWNCAGLYIDETQTDATGAYTFDALAPGDYMVQFVPPEGYHFATPDAGNDDGLDSDADPETGRTTCFTLYSDDDSWDAGLHQPVIQNSGCTYGKGYWKCQTGKSEHAEFVAELFPLYLGHEAGAKSLTVADAQSANQLLQPASSEHPHNGIMKLYAHLLATKLNIANSASDDEIADFVELADAFLTENNWEDWESLSNEHREMVLGWKDSLEGYNEGLIGPGSCSE